MRATLDVTVWKFDGRGIDCGDEAAAWVSQFLETPLRVVRFDADAPRVCSPEWTPGARAVTEFSDGNGANQRSSNSILLA